jgi:hypothetical protein
VVKTSLLLRVTVEYVTGELKVYVVDRAVLADLLKRLEALAYSPNVLEVWNSTKLRRIARPTTP